MLTAHDSYPILKCPRLPIARCLAHNVKQHGMGRYCINYLLYQLSINCLPTLTSKRHVHRYTYAWDKQHSYDFFTIPDPRHGLQHLLYLLYLL